MKPETNSAENLETSMFVKEFISSWRIFCTVTAERMIKRCANSSTIPELTSTGYILVSEEYLRIFQDPTFL